MPMWTRTLLRMRLPTLIVSTLTLVLSCSLACAQKEQSLPRVLIIGDSVYNQPSRSVGAELKGRVTVVYAAIPKDTVLNSATAIQHLDHLLGRFDRNGKPVPKKSWPTWDVIHINVGLGDLVYRAPDMKSFRLQPIHAGGVVSTKPQQYEKNLDVMITQLKATGARVVWASTTPIRYSRSNVFKLGSEVEYNKLAARVMKKHSVPISDMYTYAKSIMNMDKPASHGFDPFNFDKKPIHGQVVEIIARELKIKLEPVQTPAKSS